MEEESKQLSDEMARLCWYMRGSVSWSEAHQLSHTERQIISKVIKDNIETVKKTKMPLL